MIERNTRIVEHKRSDAIARIDDIIKNTTAIAV